MSIKEPFVLVSTGQWSIALNPFYGGSLSIHDIAKGCMFYMLPDGHPVLGHRLTVGDKYQQQLQRLATFYSVSIKKIHKIRYDKSRHKKIMKAHHRYFDFAHLEHQPSAIEMLTFDDISHAYHQLMAELVDYHISGISHVLKDANVQKIFVEGEFAANRLFMKMLARRLKTYVIQKSTLKMSSAIGAALALKSNWWNAKFLHRSLKKA